MIAGRALIILCACASCAHTPSHPVAKRVDAILETSHPLIEGPVSVTGKIYPSSRNSIYLGRESYVLEGDERRPPSTECVHLLASQDQFERLRGAAGKIVTIHGHLRLIDRSPDAGAILMEIVLEGRRAHPYCQYDRTPLPVVVLRGWSGP